MPLHSIHRGVSGLQAAQRNLAVTGHNMANVSTQGFSRQRVNQMTFAYNNIGRTASTTNQVGLGTDIAGIQQLRHQFTDIRYRMEVGRANFYTTMHSNSLALEVTMSELTRVGEGTSGIIATNRLWNSLQELSMNPSGMDTRSNFISAARSYINRMNDTHRRLIEQQQDLNGQVITMVDDVNSLVQTIREMNFRINLEEASGQAANDFRDTRNLAMDRLVALLDVEFRSNPINGHVNIMANGHPLLSDGLVFHVGLRFTEPGSSFVEPVVGLHLQPGDPTLLFDPTFSNAHALLRLDRPPMDIDRPGSIMGTVMARGLFAANHASQYQRIGFIFTGVTATNPSGFTVPPPGTAPTHIHDGRGNFLAENVDLTPQQFARALQHQEARMAFNANYTVIPRTIRHLDTAFNHLITMLNEMFTNQNANINDPSQWGGADPATWVNSANPGDHTLNLSNTAGVPIFTIRQDGLGNDILPINPYSIYAGFWDNRHQNNLNFTLGNVILNEEFDVPGGYNLIGTARNELDRDDTYIIINQVLEAWQRELLSVDGSIDMNIDDFYRFIVADLSIRTQEMETAASTQTFIVDQADGDRHRAFGVALDEELTNMIMFQHSFNAASRVINTINEMILTVINL